MANKAREEWEKLKSGGKSSYTGGVTPSGNAARDRWNRLKTTMSRPSSALEKPVVDREEGDANGYMTEWQRKQELKRLRELYTVGDASAENKEILQKIRELSGVKPNLVQRAANTVSAGVKSSAAQTVNVGGSFLEGMEKLNDAAFDSQYAEQIKAANNSITYWTGVLNDAKSTDEEKARAEQLIERERSWLESIGEFKEMQTKDISAAAEKVYQSADKLAQSAEKDVEKAQEGLGTVGKFLVEAGVGGTQLAGDIALGLATGGGAMLPMVVRSFGGSAQEARQAGGTYGEQVAYGLGSAALAAATESISNIASPLAKAFGAGFADDVVKGVAGKLNNSQAGRVVLSALSEGGEEAVESLIQPLLQRITYNEEAGYSAETVSDMVHDFLLGAVLGGTVGGVGEVSGATLNNLIKQNENLIRQRKNDEVEASKAAAADKAVETMLDDEAEDADKNAAVDMLLENAGVKAEDTARNVRARKAIVEPVAARDFSEEEARYIVQEGAKEFGNAASSVVNSYMRGQDPQLYMAQARLAFNYGKTMSEEKGLPYALKSPSLKSMDETQIRSLFNAGRMQAKSIPVSAVKGTGRAVLGDGIDYTLLSPEQKTQVNALSAFAKATGYTIEFFESKADAEGRYTAEQGSFNTKTGVIRIDINAGRDKVDDLTNYAMVRVASHEITHSFKKNAPQQYVALRDYVTGVLADKGKFEDLVDTKMRDLGIDHETAVDEVVADGCEMMLRDTHFAEKLARENRTLFEKIRDAVHKFFETLKAAFKGVKVTHEEAKLLKDAENLQKLWDEALARSVENVAAAELAEAGIAVNEETESGSLYSVRDVLSDADRKKVSKMLVKQFGVTEAEAMNWLKAETSMASLILNPKYSMYLDYDGDPNEVAIKKNSDYPQGTVDFSNICKKRREFTQVMNRVLRNFPNHVFAATDLAKIRTIMGQEGMTLPCGICYVEDRRQLDTIVAQDFIDSLKSYREGSKTRPNGKPFNPNQLKGLQMTDGDTYVPSIYELVTLEGRNALKAKNPNMEAAWVKYNNARGMQAVRLLTNEAEYKRQILKYRPKTVQSKNDHGGLRIYSFSDAEMFHLIDIVQVITDSAAVGLKIQGYTKVNEYAKAVRDTGLKLNRSLIPAGDLGYHMEDGRVVLDYDPVEGIDIHHKDFFDSTDNPNVGNIVIGINDTQIRAAMVSDFVDMVIPFHTGQSEDVLGEKGIAAWENYKDYQTEKDIATGKTSKHQVNIYTEVIQAAEQEGNPIRNKRQFVEKFLEVCKKNGLKPRFAQFLNTDADGNYVYTEGYHKFLVDFKMFAQTAEGEYLPQLVVKPIFDDAYVTDILKSYVKEQQTKDAEGAKQMPRVIERITDEIIKPEGVAESGDVMYSKRDSEYMAAVERGDMGAAQRMVDEAAKAAGYTIEAYHGTNAEFFAFDKGRVGKGQDVYGSGFYFASDLDAAEAYGKRIISSRLKLENPYRVIVRPTSGGLRDIKLTQKQVYEILKRHPKIRAEDSPLGDFYEEFWEQGAKDWMIRGLARQYTDLQTLEGDLFRDYPNELHKAIRDVTGHDGIEVRFQRDETGFSPEDESAFYVAWFDNQMKSSEPVVRDDAGEVIPLSQRFDESQSDIRYSKRDYSYAALTSKPDMTVTAVREETQYDRKTVVENALKSAASVGRRTENGNAVIKVRDIGRDVVVTKRSLVHGLDRRLNVQAPVLENVGSVLQNAIRINELTPRRDDVESTYVLVGAARGTKGMYIASFVVNSITDEVTTVDVLYALNAKKESAALLPKFTDESATPTDSVISVANLLDYVNQYFPDILPEDVLKHYGHDERPAGKLGADALFSFRTGYIPTDRGILSAYVPKDSDSDMVKRHIAEYQKNVEELRKLEQTLREQREQMRGLTGDGNKMRRAVLREEIIKTQNRIQIASDQLLRKEKWMGVRTVLNREKDALVKRARAEEREKLKKYREQRWDTESRRKMRERITYRVKTLDKMLRNPTDDKHIPEELRKAVFDFCEVFQDEVGVFSQKQLDRLSVAYEKLAKETEGENASYLYDEDIKEMISQLGVLMDGKRLSELSVEALQFVRNIADHMYFIVRDENEVFLHGRKVKMQTIATKAIEEAKESEKKGGLTIGRDGDAFLKFLTSGNLKPVYLFERTGNQLRDLFNGLLAGQSEYGRREQKAKAFVEQVKKDTNYSKWSSSEETLKMKNGAGQEIELTVQQAMSLLATYERELRSGKTNHVTMGGFVYENGLTGDVTVKGVKVPVVKRKVEAEAHPMTVEDMDKVRSWLGEVDPRVLDYMEKMVEYLSTTMSEYGNETSMQLHGYKKFGEDYYFPIRSSDEYLSKDPGKGGFDENRWKNKGFTKTVDKGANNQFVLIDFDKVWSNHVSQMLMYSTMAVPQESFVRVLNFKTPVDPTGLSNSESMRSVIKQYYGSKVADYIDTLLRDVNGGVATDSRENALNRFVSLYKKNAVLGSMSVTVQQISSVARAMAIIDPKYFAKGKPFADFQEALEHSGVAVIKQMGGFDTTTGRGGAEWLMEEVPGGKFRDAKSFSEGLKMFVEKGKALTQFGEKDTGYRDRWLGALPARMDELGFGMIWNAAKNEVSDGGEYEDGTDAFYEAVTKRFEEVIEKTQVYDSVLSRSENMRSKGNLMKAATSFMAEPTVTANMMMDSVWKLRRNKDEDSRKYLGRVIAALLLSVIANNFLKAFATAPRDKDKDQTIVEKWFEDFVGGTVNDLIVTNYIPYLREVTSVVMGYGVEATWFAPAEDLINATMNWIRDGEFSWGATKDIVNAVSAFKGLPTKNLLRIPESIINLFANTASIKEWSWRGMENAALEGILGGLFMPGVDDAMEKAFNADRRGNDAQRKKALEELAKLYEDKAKQFRLEGKEDAAKKAKSSLKSSITAYLKPLYQAAKTQAEKNRIKSLALRVYVGGQQLYSGYDFGRYWGEE